MTHVDNVTLAFANGALADKIFVEIRMIISSGGNCIFTGLFTHEAACAVNPVEAIHPATHAGKFLRNIFIPTWFG